MATRRAGQMQQTLPMSRARWPERYRLRIIFSASVIALSAFAVTARGEDRAESIKTATPIKHVIVLIAENRSFDHIFGVYKPADSQRIDSLLSRGIVNEDGTPYFNFRT